MQKGKPPIKIPEVLPPERLIEVPEPDDPIMPVLPEEDPDVIPEEDPFEVPPYEVPPPGEGP